MAGELMNLQYKIDAQNEKNAERARLSNVSINFMLAGLVLARTGLCPYGCFPVNPGMSTGFDHQNFPFHLFRWECHNLHPV